MTPSRWTYFSVEELRCRCGCGRADMDADFMPKIVMLRRLLGFPFIVSSAFRCPEYNQEVSSSGPAGPHTTGRAIDIVVGGANAMRLVVLAPAHGITGIGIKQHGPWNKRFIHLDDLQAPAYPRPTIWSYR